MRRLSLIRLLFAFLALQLAGGVQLGVAYAAAHNPTAAAHSDGCPTHAHVKHDCCKTSGCDSHCGSLMLACGFVASVVTLTPDRVVSMPEARISSGPIEPHFRPPIAA